MSENNPPEAKLISINDVPCCPEITKDPCCERLQFAYRLENRTGDVPVEIVVVAELERCPGPLALGDVVYSTTLLPGEKVRLYTSNRNNRFTYDNESEVSYRHEQASEETYYMSAMDRFMSDLTVSESASGGTSVDSEFETEGSVSNWTSAIFGRPNARVSGEFSAESSFDFMRDLSRHAESSHERSVQGTRASSSVAVGEVQSRFHAEGESESAYEATTRTIENPNQCQSVTYLAYQLTKRQTIRFRIKAVLRRVIDPAADASAETRPLRPNPNVSVLPSGVLATNVNRLEVETVARTSAAANRANAIGGQGEAIGFGLAGLAGIGGAVRVPKQTSRADAPITPQVRARALTKVDESLVAAGVLDKVGGQVSPALRAELEFERTTCLPTQAIVVKGCLDDCVVCEPTRAHSIQLDLQRQELENKLLERQIELLEKSQEYRCCPADEEEDDGDD
ncbi:MAG: hypothetical protein ACR2QK_04090 [Acidimicrobiales bacterium]